MIQQQLIKEGVKLLLAMFDLLAAMVQQPQTKRGSKRSEQAAPPLPQHLLSFCSGDPKKPASGLPSAKKVPSAVANTGLHLTGMAAALGIGRQAGGHDQQPGCLLHVPVDKYCWQPTLPHCGCCKKRNPS